MTKPWVWFACYDCWQLKPLPSHIVEKEFYLLYLIHGVGFMMVRDRPKKGDSIVKVPRTRLVRGLG